MRAELSQRLSAAMDEVRALGAADAERYVRELRRSDPEVARRLDVLLALHEAGDPERTSASRVASTPSSPDPPPPAPGAPTRRDPVPVGEPTVSADARRTASFSPPPPGDPADASLDPRATVSQVLGRYQLLRVVGRGGFGEVWKAYDPVLQKHVAVKAPQPREGGRRLPPAAFLHEARKAASLRHPAIVQVYDVGESAEGWYIVSEFVEGESLQRRLEAGRPPFEQSARVIATVAGALHTAHLAGLVHRDVKPANVLLDRAGSAYLTDFGLAVREEEQLAERSKVSGTLAYMSPEQIRGDTHLMDGRADIYALGAVFYEMLTGRPLFRAATFEEYQELILRREPRPPRSVDDAVPEELERICLKCLAKEVKDRYRTAQDLAADLEAWLARAPRPAPTPARRAAGWWKPAAVAAAVVCVLAAALGVAALLGVFDPRRTEPTARGPLADPPRVDPPRTEPARKVPAVKPLRWPPASPDSKWEVLADPDRLKVYSESTSLLQLGETQADSWELSATIKQVARGRVGLFLGHQKDARTATASYELVRLIVAGNETFLHRRIETYKLGVPLAEPDGVTHASARVQTPSPEYTIRLVVRGNRLAEVWLNGAAVPELARPAVELTAAGPYGTYNRGSDGVFSKLLLNDRPIPLLAEADARPPENR